jgi:hypothetical protein
MAKLYSPKVERSPNNWERKLTLDRHETDGIDPISPGTTFFYLVTRGSGGKAKNSAARGSEE